MAAIGQKQTSFYMRLVLSLLALIAITFVGWGPIAPLLFVPWAVVTTALVFVLGRRWRAALPVAACVAYMVVAGAFAAWAWIPGVLTLEVGGKVLVANGVAQAAYYDDIWRGLAIFGVAVIVTIAIYGFPEFQSKQRVDPA